MTEPETCCGFGGTFSVKFGEISHAHGRQQVRSTSTRSGADAVVLGDLGCMLNIEGRLRRRGDTRRKVLHVAEVLAGRDGGADAGRVDALQGAGARRARRRAAAEEPRQVQAQVRCRAASRRSSSSTTSRARATPARRSASAALDDLDVVDRDVRGATPRRAAPPCCSRRRRRRSTGSCSTSLLATACARSSSRSRWCRRSRRSTTRSKAPA